MADPVSFSAYARMKGWSQPYISQLVAQGVIPVTADRKIDPEAADAAIAAGRDPAAQPVADRHAAARRARAAAAGSSTPPAPPASPPSGTAAPVGQFHQAKTATEVFRAKNAELEYRRAIGSLVEADEVRRAIRDNLGPAVKQLETLAPRIAARVAAVGGIEARQVQSIIDAEVDAIRTEIANVAGALLERIGQTSQ